MPDITLGWDILEKYLKEISNELRRLNQFLERIDREQKERDKENA